MPNSSSEMFRPGSIPDLWQFWTFLVDLVRAQMKEIIVSMLLLLLGVVIPVTSSMDSAQVVSFRKSRKLKNGPAMCALDAANETKSSSSPQDCSLDCTRDGTCTDFNIRNSDTCDIYNYEPRILIAMPACENYKVPVVYCITHYHAYIWLQSVSRACERSVSGRYAAQRQWWIEG